MRICYLYSLLSAAMFYLYTHPATDYQYTPVPFDITEDFVFTLVFHQIILNSFSASGASSSNELRSHCQSRSSTTCIALYLLVHAVSTRLRVDDLELNSLFVHSRAAESSKHFRRWEYRIKARKQYSFDFCTDNAAAIGQTHVNSLFRAGFTESGTVASASQQKCIGQGGNRKERRGRLASAAFKRSRQSLTLRREIIHERERETVPI